MWDDVQSWKFLKVEINIFTQDEPAKSVYEEHILSAKDKVFEEQRNTDFLKDLITKVREAGEIINSLDQEGNSIVNKWPRLPAKVWFEQAKLILPNGHGIEMDFEYYAWDGNYGVEPGEFIQTRSNFEASYWKP